jgi:hypothetical protein
LASRALATPNIAFGENVGLIGPHLAGSDATAAWTRIARFGDASSAKHSFAWRPFFAIGDIGRNPRPSEAFGTRLERI